MGSTFAPAVVPAGQPDGLPPVVGRFRRAFVRVLICCLCVTGLLAMAIVARASIDQLEFQVLLTTLLVAAYSVLCLGALVSSHGPWAWVGRTGVAFSSLALGNGLLLIWTTGADWMSDGTAALEFLLRSFAFTGILGVAFAHSALVLWAARCAGPIARASLGATLVAIGVVAAMLADLALFSDGGGNPTFWRTLAVLSILDAVGTVVTPMVARLDRSPA